MDGATAGMGITIKPRRLQTPYPTALIERDHAVRLRVQEAGLDGYGGGAAREESHIAFKVAKDGRKFRRPLLSIPTQIAQVSGMRQEDPATFVVMHSYSFLE
jgi:hypothetical protein